MTTDDKYARLIDGELYLFVEQLFSVPLNDQLAWLIEELDDPACRGAIARAFDRVNSDIELGYVLVADITGDPDEKDISFLDEEGDRQFHQQMLKLLVEGCEKDGRTFVKLFGSIRRSIKIWPFDHIVTSYTLLDPLVGKRLYMDARVRCDSRNITISVCINDDAGEEAGSAIINSWLNSQPSKQIIIEP